MITTLKERKTKLLSQIEELKREIETLKWAEYKALALGNCTGSVSYYSLDTLPERARN